MFYEILIGGMLFIAIIMAIAVFAALMSLILIYIFIKTNHAIFPRIVLFIAGVLEAPIRQLLWVFKLDERTLYSTLTELRNLLYKKKFHSTPKNQRALFLPQCLRHVDCPATLNEEGLQCKKCGLCKIAEIQDYAKALGYRVFIAPGSTLVYRMIKKYKPKAVIGVGCHMEIKEGTEKLAAYGMPVQGVFLLNDGCVATDINIKKLKEALNDD